MDELIELLRALARHEHSDVSIAEEAADRLAELEEQLHLANIDALQTEAERAALEAENQRLRAEVRDVLANLDAPDDMDVISAAHFVAGSLSTAEEALEAAQAEARGLRAELARVRGLCPEVIAFAHLMQRKLDMNACKDGAGWDRDGTGRRGWKNCDISFLREKLTEEVVELIVAIKEPVDRDDVAEEAADVGNIAMMLADVCGALSQPAEQHDPLAVSDHCPECSEPEPECVCGEQPAERESLPQLWSLFVPGPNEHHPQPSREAAKEAAKAHNAFLEAWHPENRERLHLPPIEQCRARVEPWPFSAEEHAEELAEAQRGQEGQP